LYSFSYIHACYMFHESHLHWLDHRNNIWWSVQVRKLFIMQPFPASRHFLVRRCTCSLKHPVHRNSPKWSIITSKATGFIFITCCVAQLWLGLPVLWTFPGPLIQTIVRSLSMREEIISKGWIMQDNTEHAEYLERVQTCNNQRSNCLRLQTARPPRWVAYLMSVIYKSVSKSFRTESITKYRLSEINTNWEATQRVMATKFTNIES
jgi:hypothetical protein